MAVVSTTPTGSSLWSKAFWKGAAERAVKTFAQSAAALLTADVAGLLNVDFVNLASVAGLAALVSLLMSVGNHDFVAGKGATVVPLAPAAPAPEALVVPDGDGKYRAGSPAAVGSEPVIHEN